MLTSTPEQKAQPVLTIHLVQIKFLQVRFYPAAMRGFFILVYKKHKPGSITFIKQLKMPVIPPEAGLVPKTKPRPETLGRGFYLPANCYLQGGQKGGQHFTWQEVVSHEDLSHDVLSFAVTWQEVLELSFAFLPSFDSAAKAIKPTLNRMPAANKLSFFII